MSTVIANAVGAVVAALQAAPAVSSQVHRVRLRPLSAAQPSMVVVRPVEADVDQAQLAGPVISWDAMLAVECYTRAPAGTDPDVAVDSLLEAVHARLMADPTLGGAVVALQPRKVSYDFDADDQSTVCAVSFFTARLRAAGASL